MRCIAYVLIFLIIFVAGNGDFSVAPNPILWICFLSGYALIVAVDLFIQHHQRKLRTLGKVLGPVLVLFSLLIVCHVAWTLWQYPDLALRSSVTGGYKPILLWSVRHGADVNGTPMWSTFYGDYVKGKGTPDEPHRRPLPLPLEVAIVSHRPDSVDLLLDLGADPNYVFRDGEPIGLLAAGNRNVDVLRVLMRHGMNVNTRAIKNGTTALMVAIRLQDASTIRFLLENGADPNIQDIYGETATMKVVCSSAPGAPKWVELLLSKGADRTIKDKAGHTALDHARDCNCVEAVELLSR